MTGRMRAEFECDYCGRIAQVAAPPGELEVHAPGSWVQIGAWEVAGGRNLEAAEWVVNGDRYRFGIGRMLHFCSMPCAWWATARAQPDATVTVVDKDGGLYGQSVVGWEPPPDPRGGQ